MVVCSSGGAAGYPATSIPHPPARATSSFLAYRFRLCVMHVRASCSVEFKFHFNTNLHAYWLSVFQSRIEAPLLHGLHRLRIQPESKSVDDSNVARTSNCVNNQPQRTCALRFRPASLVCVLGIGRQDWLRRRYSATYSKHAPTNATTAPGANTCAVSDSSAAAGTGSNAAARTGSIGGRSGRHRCNGWNAKVGYVIFRQVYLWRNNDGGLCCQLGFQVANHNLRRRDPHCRELGESSLGCRQGIMISPATTASDHLIRGSQYV